ncbi:MAG: ribonuclease R, partial [Clostridia bacterium]|nr:ribonuclease R [Clostridia bacterium]
MRHNHRKGKQTKKKQNKASRRAALRRAERAVAAPAHRRRSRERNRTHALVEQLGIFHGTARGFGFVTPDPTPAEPAPDDIFVPARLSGGAIDGDRVRFVRRASDDPRDDRPTAEVVAVEARAVTSCIGELCVESHIRGRRTVRRFFVRPANARLAFEIEVFPTDTLGAREGDKVEVTLTEYPGAYSAARGRVTHVFGAAESRAANYAAILWENGIPTVFPDEVLAEADAVSSVRVTSRGRLDLRDEIIFTIDGADAKDLDDAISLKRTADGWQLGVHIADVSYYVKPGSALDREAMRRGTSVYFTDQVVPMLPVALSNGCCSLNGGVARYAMSAILDLSPDGSLRGCELAASVIRSRVRGVYSEVNDIFARGDASEFAAKYAEVMPVLRDMHALYEILARRSAARGALALETAEAQILLDADGEPVDIVRRERGDAEKMIEQFMLTANEGVATWLQSRGLPCVYRVHEKPVEDKIRAFAEFASNLGLPVGRLGQGIASPQELAAVVGAAREKGIAEMVSVVLLRSLQKARYATQPLGHFGLGIALYAHFTSPIRRYPDLSVHRIIRAALSGRTTKGQLDRLNSFAERSAVQSSENELRALTAEREIEELYKTIFMAAHVGEAFDARISSVTGFGIFAELENTCEGLIPITTLDGYFVYDEKNHRLTCGSQVYCLGDAIRVRIVSADV